VLAERVAQREVEQRVLARDVRVQRAGRDAEPARDVGHLRAPEALLGEHLRRRAEERLEAGFGPPSRHAPIINE